MQNKQHSWEQKLIINISVNTSPQVDFCWSSIVSKYIQLSYFSTLYTCIWCNAQTTSLPSSAFFSKKTNNRIREQEDSMSFSCVAQILDALHVCSAYTERKRCCTQSPEGGSTGPVFITGRQGFISCAILEMSHHMDQQQQPDR